MYASDPLAAQLAALDEQRKQAERAADVLARLDQRLAVWARGELQDELADVKERTDALRKNGGSGASTAERWNGLARERERASELFGECLALAQGAWARSQIGDGEFHDLADRFVEELSTRSRLDWHSLTVPAEREFYADLAQVIRVAYPSVGIWELPLSAHEFGHFAAERLSVVEHRGYRRRRRLPAGEAIAEEGAQGDHSWALAHEYFADAFATYAVGPAYPWAFLVLRSDPVAAGDDDLEHPAFAKRVRLMLQVLAAMDRDRIGSVRFGRRITDLGDLWRTTLEGAGEPPDLDPVAAADVDARAETLYALLRATRKGLAYDSFHLAQAIAPGLSPGRSEPALDPAARIVDVVNAAWIHRRGSDQGEVALAKVEARVRRLCATVPPQSAVAA